MVAKRATMILGLLLGLALGVAGCNVGPTADVFIFVDNGSQQPIRVSVDGGDEVTIEPGTHGKVECDFGTRELIVRRGPDLIFKSTKEIKPPDKAGSRRFVLNPDKMHYYVVYTVRYGSNPFEGLLKDKKSEAAKSALQKAYEKLAGDVDLMPPPPWFEVPPGGVWVLSKVPPFVTNRGGHSEKRKVMVRVDARDYSFLKTAVSKSDPTEGDLKALSDMMDKLEELAVE